MPLERCSHDLADHLIPIYRATLFALDVRILATPLEVRMNVHEIFTARTYARGMSALIGLPNFVFSATS